MASWTSALSSDTWPRGAACRSASSSGSAFILICGLPLQGRVEVVSSTTCPGTPHLFRCVSGRWLNVTEVRRTPGRPQVVSEPSPCGTMAGFAADPGPAARPPGGTAGCSARRSRGGTGSQAGRRRRRGAPQGRQCAAGHRVRLRSAARGCLPDRPGDPSTPQRRRRRRVPLGWSDQRPAVPVERALHRDRRRARRERTRGPGCPPPVSSTSPERRAGLRRPPGRTRRAGGRARGGRAAAPSSAPRRRGRRRPRRRSSRAARPW